MRWSQGRDGGSPLGNSLGKTSANDYSSSSMSGASSATGLGTATISGRVPFFFFFFRGESGTDAGFEEGIFGSKELSPVLS